MSKIEKQVQYTYNGTVCTFLEALAFNGEYLFCTKIQGQCVYIITDKNLMIVNKSKINGDSISVGQRLKQTTAYYDATKDDFFVKSRGDIYINDKRVVQVDEDMNIIKEWISDGK